MLILRTNSLETLEKPLVEGWLVNGEQKLVVQFRPDVSVNHGQWFELRTYSWIRPHPPVPQTMRKVSRATAIDTWKHMVQVGWRQCSPPVR